MQSAQGPTPRFFRFFSALFILPVFIFIFTALVLTAAKLQVDYFDSFSIYSNARAIATHHPEPFFRDRPAMLPALLSGLFLLEPVLRSPGAAVQASRILDVLFFAGFLAVFFKLLRLFLPKAYALWGIFYCALNPLLIHFAPFVREDIPGLFFITAAFYFYLRQSRAGEWRPLCCASAAAAAAMAMRFQLAGALFLIFFADMLFTGNIRLYFRLKAWPIQGNQFDRRLLFLFLIPTALFFLIPSAVNIAAGRCVWWKASKLFMDERVWQANLFALVSVPVGTSLREALQLLFACLPKILWGAVFLGAWKSLKENRRAFFLFGGWFLTLFLFQAFVLRHNEARYFFPLFPPLYFFMIRGLGFLGGLAADFFKKKGARVSRNFYLMALFVTFSLLPLRGAASEILKFRDPVYTTNFELQVCRAAKKASSGRNIYWAGPMYTLYPDQYLFHPDDPYTYMYHFFNHVCEFYTGDRVTVFNLPVFGAQEEPAGLFVPGLGNWVHDGDVLIVNPGGAYKTKTVPVERRPLVVEKIKRIFFYAQALPEQGDFIFLSPEAPGGRIRLRETSTGLQFQGERLRDGYYEMYALSPGSSHAEVLGLLKVLHGKFTMARKSNRVPQSIAKIALLYFNHVERHDPPGLKSHPL